MLARVGWKKDFLEYYMPVLPMSGWIEDNVLHSRLGNLLTVKQICSCVERVVLRHCRLQAEPISNHIFNVWETGQMALGCTSDFVNVQLTLERCEGVVFSLQRHANQGKRHDHEGANWVVRRISSSKSRQSSNVWVGGS